MIYKKPDKCPFNKNVECFMSKSDCNTCGWNPVVQEERKRELHQSPNNIHTRKETK